MSETRKCGSCAYFKTPKCRDASSGYDLIVATDDASRCPDFEFRQRFLTSEETSLDYAKLASQVLRDPLMTAAVLLRFRGTRP